MTLSRATNLPEGQRPFAADSKRLYAFLLACGFTAFYVYFRNIVWPGYKTPPFPLDMYNDILRGAIESPYAYRVLVPLLIKALVTPLTGLGLKVQDAFLAGYTIYCLAAIEFSVIVLFRLMRRWFDATLSIIGIMMFCMMVAISARDHYFSAFSLIEPGFYAAAILLAANRRGWWAFALTLVATLNRETGLFVPLLFCSALPGRWLDRNRIVWLVILGAAWLAVFLGLRMVIGMRPDPTDINYHMHINLLPISIVRTILAIAAMFSLFLPAVLVRFRVPDEIRRCLWTLPVYTVLVLLFSQWWEVRLWLSVACLLLPLAMGGLQAALSTPQAPPAR